MQQAGGNLVKHYRQLAFMGFTEVIMNLRTIFKNLKFCKEDILSYKPDAIILIDYPGFNPPAMTGPLPPLPAGDLDSEERGVTYSRPSEVPISRGGEVEDEAVPRKVGKR